MEIPVLVDPVVGDGFVAKMGEPLSLTASGSTRDEAIKNLEQAVHARLQNGATIASVHIPLPPGVNPWVAFAGMFKDDPMFDEVVEIMKQNRKAEDADPNFL